MNLKRPTITYTVADMADRIARVTGIDPAFHARQIRNWSVDFEDGDHSPQSVLGVLGAIPRISDRKTSSRLYNLRHLAGARIAHHLAQGGLELPQIRTAMRLLRNINREKNVAFSTNEDGARHFNYHDGLAVAIAVAKRIVDLDGEDDGRFRALEKLVIYFEFQMTKEGELRLGHITADPKGASSWDWGFPERRIINLSTLLPGLLRDQDGNPEFPASWAVSPDAANVWETT